MAAKKKSEEVVIKPLRENLVILRIEGTAPYVQGKFSYEALQLMRATQEAGSQSKAKKKREAKNFDDLFEQCLHRSEDGWIGIPANALRAAMIRACKAAGFVMTDAKCSIFVEADGFDPQDGTPLVRIQGDPEKFESYVRNANGSADIRVRAIFKKWSAEVVIRYDEDQFSLESVSNLLHRAGAQVGIGHGRPFSRESTGMGWGTFRIVTGENNE